MDGCIVSQLLHLLHLQQRSLIVVFLIFVRCVLRILTVFHFSESLASLIRLSGLNPSIYAGPTDVDLQSHASA